MKLQSMKTTAMTVAMVCSFAVNPASATTNSPTEVGLKCELMYMSWGKEETPFLRSVRTMDLKPTSYGRSTNYKFDQMETLKVAGRPDLKIWIRGNYMHDQEEERSYLRFTTAFCEAKPGNTGVKCYGDDYSDDVFTNTVRAANKLKGKKVQIGQNSATLIDFANSLEVQMNYRIKTGRSLLEDLDNGTSVPSDQYIALVSPTVSVACSVRDDAYGVISAY